MSSHAMVLLKAAPPCAEMLRTCPMASANNRTKSNRRGQVHHPTSKTANSHDAELPRMLSRRHAKSDARAMARQPRLDLPGIPQHVVPRGNNRQPCFLTDDDRQRYLTPLGEALLSTGCKLHAYVLMDNRVHLLLSLRPSVLICSALPVDVRCPSNPKHPS